MKKILALVLAVLMMATVAFAAAATVAPGTKIKFDISTPAATMTSKEGGVTVGSTATAWTTGHKEINSKNFNVSALSFTSGKALVKSITINDDGELVIELNQDYALLSSKNKTVAGTFKVTEKGKSITNIFTVGGTGNELTVGYLPGFLQMSGTGVVISDAKTAGTPILRADYKNYAFTAVDAGVAYTTWTMEAANDTAVTAKIYKDDKLFLASNDTPDVKVLKAAPEDAALTFTNFPGKPTYNSTASVYFYAADEKSFVYENKDGVLTKVGKYSADDGCWVVKTRTLGNYVVSDKALASAADAKPANPDTGANDVVGIATALAAVALVSAAAVSLKK